MGGGRVADGVVYGRQGVVVLEPTYTTPPNDPLLLLLLSPGYYPPRPPPLAAPFPRFHSPSRFKLPLTFSADFTPVLRPSLSPASLLFASRTSRGNEQLPLDVFLIGSPNPLACHLENCSRYCETVQLLIGRGKNYEGGNGTTRYSK